MECTETAAERARTKQKFRALFTILGKPHTMSILSFFVHSRPNGARFNEILQQLELAPNTLSRRLKELDAYGLLERQEFAEVPPRVEYRPTEAARSMGTVFQPLHEWMAEHADQLLD